MKVDYDAIGDMAKALGCRRTDLIALASGNDPFYAGVNYRTAAGEWFAKTWDDLNCRAGSHLRRIHYVIVSQPTPILKPNGSPYLNTLDDWKFLGIASLAARYRALIPDGALADHRNDPPMIFAAAPLRTRLGCEVDSPIGFGFPRPERRNLFVPGFRTATLAVPQDYLVEVWVEKSTQNDILVPMAQRLGFNLQTGAGETSETLAREAINRAMEDGRPMRILYVSDFDPGGRSMPVALARKIEYWVRETELDLDITQNPIILLPEQVERYALPRTPMKETERRAARFEDRFGEGAVELDALEAIHPGELARIVESEVCRYIDPTLKAKVNAVNGIWWGRIAKAEREVLADFDIDSIQDSYDEIADDFETRVSDLEEETADLWPKIAAELEANAPTFDGELPTPRPATPPSAPLFDSKRSYLDQIDHYREWQGRGDAA